MSLGLDGTMVFEDMRDPRGPMSYPAFRRMMLARFLSSVGSTMQVVAAGWLVLELTGSSMDVGLLAAVALGPSLFLGPVAGSLADRYCPRKLSIALNWVQVVPTALLALFAFEGWLTFPWILFLVFLGAVPASMSTPILAIIIPFSVPAELRHRSVNLTSASRNVGLILGSLFGGFTVAHKAAWLAFATNSLSYAVLAVVLMVSPVLQAACDLARARGDASVREGVRQGWPHVVVRVGLLTGAAFFLLVGPVQQLLPTIAQEHGDAMLLGWLFALLSIGSLATNSVLGRVLKDGSQSGRVLVVGLVVGAAGAVVLGLVPSLAGDLVGLVLVGVAWEMVFVAGTGSMQLDVPVEISGRLTGIYFLLIAGATALGSVALGWCFDQAGLGPTLVACGTVALAAAAGVWVRYRPAPSRD